MTVEELQSICTGIKLGEYVPLLDDLLNGRAMIVDTNWLEEHDKQMIDKAWKYIVDSNYSIDTDFDEFRKAIEL